MRTKKGIRYLEPSANYEIFFSSRLVGWAVCARNSAQLKKYSQRRLSTESRSRVSAFHFSRAPITSLEVPFANPPFCHNHGSSWNIKYYV
ncbi:hypothetical protein ALC60_10784 [Trachymyrmex zeteki]|uniref:Uncharacterized protein n=1 Tax=Mycetomoellerius zeteki TaxID=64791 RepID=A0A151WQQ0_9HYME|nr:hypothetical protein ALC60_10784 [Trachymyrmex zeteki]